MNEIDRHVEIWTEEQVDRMRVRDAAPALLAACEMVLVTAQSAHETGHTEGEVLGANWDVLGSMLRAAIAKAK